MPRKIEDLPQEVTQSHIITSARYKFSVYEKRVLYRIIELVQDELGGVPLKPGIQVQPSLFANKEVKMPLSMFLLHNEERDRNYPRIKESFKRLQNKSIEKYLDGGEVIGYPLIQHYHIKPKKGYVSFQISKNLYEDLLDFAKGFTQYELKTAFSFRSQYTMRLYELISKQEKPLTYSIARLREMFRLEDKYSVTTLFIQRVIDPAQKELEASDAPCFFTYESVKTKRSITHICFTTHSRVPREVKNLLASPKDAEEREKLNHLLKYLSEHLGVSGSAFKPHFQLILDNLRLPTANRPQKELDIIIKGAKKADISNRVGYVVNALKNRIKPA